MSIRQALKHDLKSVPKYGHRRVLVARAQSDKLDPRPFELRVELPITDTSPEALKKMYEVDAQQVLAVLGELPAITFYRLYEFMRQKVEPNRK